ncbi:MAG: serine/threonine-protein kinase [Deltaproteobacteria bacterium]|nr:serine/threonine-protein kinase [Deltaproteobacteria bacterium]
MPLDPERYRRLDGLLTEALERPPTQRREFLEKKCGGDVALLREVWALLQKSEEEETFLRPGGALFEGLITDSSLLEDDLEPSRRGQKIGSWILGEELGRGGMGVVYLAHRLDEDFEQEVALKLLAGFVSTPEALERFRAERQILAQLDHPCIARLVDGGTTPEGTPFFALERVQGQPIDRYCDAERLSIEKRLELFVHLCDAVAYAHRKLVVHRDLKPSNILVTRDGVPKLLDFGIAKLLVPGTTDLTRRRDRPMTPEYASPEQVRGELVSTASDVYGLGLLLYELLTGCRAHRLESRDWAEIERTVCSDPITRPSVAVAPSRAPTKIPTKVRAQKGARKRVARNEEGEVLGDPATARGTSPAKLRRRLQGDLDTIVLTALHKEPERRYPSVDRLAEDVRRHLAGLPITARSEGWTYRLGKFIRRHRIAVPAACLATVAILAGLVGTLSQGQRASREALRASEVSDFLVHLLEVSDPERTLGHEVTITEVLDRAAVRIEAELSQQPRLRARLSSLIGHLYTQLGRYPPAQDQLAQALALQEEILGTDHPDVAETLQRQAALLHDQSQLKNAEQQARRSLAIRQEQLGPTRPAVAASRKILGQVLEKQGRFEEAREQFRHTLEIQRKEFGERHPEVASTLIDWAFVEYQDGHWDEAQELYGSSLEIYRNLGDGRSVGTAEALQGLAFVGMARARDHQDNEDYLLESAEITRDLLGDGHPVLASRLETLGSYWSMNHQFDKAEESYREALEINRNAFGSDHLLIANILNNLASLRFRQERFTEAAELYHQALEQRRKLLGGDHPQTATTWSYLAYAWHRGGDPRAEGAYRDSLELLLQIRGKDHPHVANVHNDLGRLLLDTDRCPEAEPHLLSALEIRSQVFGEDAQRTSATKLNLAVCLARRGELPRAAELLDSARSIRVEARGEEAWQVAEVDLFRAELLARLGDSAEAAALLQQTTERIDSAKPEDHWLRRLARNLEARIESLSRELG